MDIGEFLLADEHSAEELVLEGYPVKRLFDILFLISGLGEVVRVAIGFVVADTGIALFEVETFLQLAGAVCPSDIERLHGGSKEIADAVCANDHIHHVSVRTEGVFDVEGAGGEGEAECEGLGARGRTLGNGNRAFGNRDRFEIKVGGDDVLILASEGKDHLGILLGEEADGFLLLVVIVLEHRFLDDTTVGVDGNFDEFVLKGDELLGALRGREEDASGVRTLGNRNRTLGSC